MARSLSASTRRSDDAYGHKNVPIHSSKGRKRASSSTDDEPDMSRAAAAKLLDLPRTKRKYTRRSPMDRNPKELGKIKIKSGLLKGKEKAPGSRSSAISGTGRKRDVAGEETESMGSPDDVRHHIPLETASLPDLNRGGLDRVSTEAGDDDFSLKRIKARKV